MRTKVPDGTSQALSLDAVELRLIAQVAVDLPRPIGPAQIGVHHMHGVGMLVVDKRGHRIEDPARSGRK